MNTQASRVEWIGEFEQAEIPYGPVNTIDIVATDPQVLKREMIIEVEHPETGHFKVINTPIKLSRTPVKINKASPDMGQNTEEILAGLGLA